jgi:hypothetical protein
MIKLFRNIRKKLITENQSVIRNTNYFKYAIGEIVLVVIGILIALQINNWNQERLTQIGVEQRLNELSAVIKEDKKDLVRYHNINIFRSHAILYLLNLVGENPRKSGNTNYQILPFVKTDLWDREIPKDENEEFIRLAISYSILSLTFFPNRSVIDEMIDRGLFYEIKNDELKNKIKMYYRIDGPYNVSAEAEFNDVLDKSFLEEGVEVRDFNLEHSLTLIKNNPKRIAYLKRIQGNAIFITNNGTNKISLVDDILKLIEQYNKK